jgi:ABC-type polysaccharide/polyol phosphate export permease
MRNILLEAKPPVLGTMMKLTFSSIFMFGTGWLVFRHLKQHFYDHL